MRKLINLDIYLKKMSYLSKTFFFTNFNGYNFFFYCCLILADINMNQGQSLQKFGVYFKILFSHTRLYVVISRVNLHIG